MPIDQSEGIQLTSVAFVVESAEVAPVHLETFAGLGFHAHKGALGLWLWSHLVNVVAQDGMTTVIAKRPQSLLDDGGSAIVGLKGSSLLNRGRAVGVCAGASKYFLMVRQLMRRCCSILRMGQCSTQYR